MVWKCLSWAHLKMQHQGDCGWQKSTTFVCILWILMGYIYIKKILLHSRNRICELWGTSQTWWLPELSVEAKLKYTVVKISVVATNGCVIIYLKLMNASTWAHAACMCGDIESLVASWIRVQRIFPSCRLPQLWNHSQILKSLKRRNEELLWTEALFGSTKAFSLDFHHFYVKIIAVLISFIKNNF